MKLAILEPLGIEQEVLLSMAESALRGRMDIVMYDTRTEDVEILAERSKDADAVLFSNIRYPKAVMEQCPGLKMICTAFTGVDHIDTAYCRERGILVSNCSGYATAAVADLVFGMIISLYRNLAQCNQAVRHQGTKDGLVGYELEGKKLGVVGCGAIGTRVMELAKAFGCQVYAYSRKPGSMKGIQYVDLEHLLTECDIISLHVPLTEETKGMIGSSQIRLMKQNAVLINTARGAVVDNAALAEALKEGRLAGAGIDVFEGEPPVSSDHPLFSAPHVLATPHVAFATKESMRKRAVIAIGHLRRWMEQQLMSPASDQHDSNVP